MADFKYAVVCEEEKQTLLALRKPENINDEKRYMEIMKTLSGPQPYQTDYL
jgi:hypothetical protein